MLDHSTSLGGEPESAEASPFLTNLGSQKKYQCPQCPSSFKRPENLKRHQRGHDESRKFMCHICDKSFARSDILGRHIAIHIPLEQRNDNPNRKRACHECARARERCSRGSPCRRCAIKSLCCLYPEEHQFKTMTPYTWSSSTSDSGDYEAPGVGWLGPQSPLETIYTGSDALLQGPEPSQWQVEGPSVPYGGLSTHSALPQSRFHPYQSNSPEFRLPLSVRHNGPSLQDPGLYLGSTSRISTDDMKLITSGAELEGMLGAYEQTINMPFDLSCSSRMNLHQYSPSTEFQDHPVRGLPFDSRPPTAPLDTRYIHDSSSIDTTMVDQPEALNFWNTPRGHEYVASTQAPGIGVDDQETLSQYVQTPYSRPIDSKSHDFITTSRGLCQDKTAALPFESTATSTGMNHQDINSHPKSRHNCFGHCDDNGLEEAGGLHTCFENLYTQ